MKQIILFTDGSCLGNPGPGGWACLLRCGSVETEVSGTEVHTTNNRMELQAVSNRDLWEALLHESSRHQVTWTWIRGHGASAEQNRCDQLAQAAARSLMVAS